MILPCGWVVRGCSQVPLSAGSQIFGAGGWDASSKAQPVFRVEQENPPPPAPCPPSFGTACWMCIRICLLCAWQGCRGLSVRVYRRYWDLCIECIAISGSVYQCVLARLNGICNRQ